MLPADDEAAAVRSASRIAEPRIHHFHDPRRLAGATFAAAVGAPGEIAWDAYLLFAPGARFGDAPRAWFHQLGTDGWADAAAFRWGEDLTRALADSIGSVP